MRKIIPIFIIFILLGIFSPAFQVEAQVGTCTTTGLTGTQITEVEQKDCSGTWEAGVWGTCKVGAVTTNPKMKKRDCLATLGTWTVNPSTLIDNPNPIAPPPPAPVNTTYNLLTPLPCPTGTQEGCEPDASGKLILKTIDVGGENALGKYLNVIIKLAIGLAAVLAVVLIVMGGIQYMTTELVSGKEDGKRRITNAVLGLLVALGAWLILFTINPDLLKTELKIETTTIQYVEDAPQTAVNGKYTYKTAGDVPVGANWEQVSARPYSNLSSWPDIKLNNPQCVTVGQQNCTSTRGLDTSWIATIKSKCPQCELTITGGTEFWLHKIGTSHRPGSPTIDLRSKSVGNEPPDKYESLNRYITGGQPLVQREYIRDGIRFLFEGDHWHVCS